MTKYTIRAYDRDALEDMLKSDSSMFETEAIREELSRRDEFAKEYAEA